MKEFEVTFEQPNYYKLLVKANTRTEAINLAKKEIEDVSLVPEGFGEYELIDIEEK